jgi:glutamyl-tRNA synthetase
LWINQQHIIATPAEELGAALMPYIIKIGLDPAEGPDPVHVAEGFHERAETLLHMAASARYCYEDFDVIDEKSAKKHLRPVILDPCRAARERLAGLEHWGQTSIHEAIEEVATDFEINLGKLGQPIRVAVTGGPVSPPIDVTLWLVGEERTIRRMDHAIDLIEARAAASD